MTDPMGIYLQSTDVPAQRSIGEITSVLVQSGARSIMSEYTPEGDVIGITFAMEVGGYSIPYRLPARVESVFAMLQQERKREWDREQNVEKDRERAVRIAWRQILMWVKAQMALIQTGMVKPEEVYLPYVRVSEHQTYFEKLEASGKLKALPAPGKGDQS